MIPNNKNILKERQRNTTSQYPHIIVKRTRTRAKQLITDKIINLMKTKYNIIISLVLTTLFWWLMGGNWFVWLIGLYLARYVALFLLIFAFGFLLYILIYALIFGGLFWILIN